MASNSADAATIGEYLKKLLVTVWREAEFFSAIRPFGRAHPKPSQPREDLQTVMPNHRTTLRDQFLKDVAAEQMPAVRAAAQRIVDRVNIAITAAAEHVHRTKGVPLDKALDAAIEICLRNLATGEPAEFERYARAMTILHDDLGDLPACTE